MQTMMKHSDAAKAFVPPHHEALTALPWWSRPPAFEALEPRQAPAQREVFPDPQQAPCCEACGRALHGAPAPQGIEVLSVRAGWRRRLLLRWDDIQVLTCDTKYINVHGIDGMVHVIEASLDRVCEDAGPHFVRIHRGHAINPKYLTSVVSRSDGSCDFVMQSGLSVPGSRRLAKPARVAIFGEPPRRRRRGD